MKDNENQEVTNEDIINQVSNAEVSESIQSAHAEDQEGQDTELEDNAGQDENSPTEATTDAKKPEDNDKIDGLEIPQPDIDESEGGEKTYKNEWIEHRYKTKELKLKREAAQRELEKEQEEIIKLHTQNVAAQLAANAPTRDDFADEAEFTEAMVNHTLAKRQVQTQAEAQARQQFALRQKLQQKIEETKSRGAAKYSNYDDVVEPLFETDSGVPPNIPLVEALNESKFGADILYMLGKNKAKAIEIASMTPLKAARWVWETERRFEEASAKSRPVSSGVKPMQKVASKLTPTKDISQMSNKEYKEFWHKKKYGN